MDSVSSEVVIEGEEAAGGGGSDREIPESEEMCSKVESQCEPTEFNVQTKKEKRKRQLHALNKILGLSEDEDDEDEPMAKRHSTDEEDSSDDECCNPALEELKQSIFDEIKDKENKLVILRWAKKHKVRCFRTMTVAIMKKQLSQLRELYEDLDGIY